MCDFWSHIKITRKVHDFFPELRHLLGKIKILATLSVKTPPYMCVSISLKSSKLSLDSSFLFPIDIFQRFILLIWSRVLKDQFLNTKENLG